jgi:hypothetical protein
MDTQLYCSLCARRASAFGARRIFVQNLKESARKMEEEGKRGIPYMSHCQATHAIRMAQARALRDQSPA